MAGHLQKHIPKNKRQGFTIVELLIVIVVIAILAAIVIVAYQGMQARARNDQTISAAKNFYTGFLGYVAQNGSLPPDQNGGNANYCLNHPVNQCVNSTAAPNWTTDTVTLEPALKTILASLPVPASYAATSSSSATNDPNLGYIPYRAGGPTLDGSPSAFLIYLLEAPATCPVGSVASGGWPTYFSARPATGYTYLNGSVVGCWVPLPNK